MKRCRLANVLFDAAGMADGNAELLYRSDSPVSYNAASGEFTCTGTVDFRTYFNGISAVKWHRYADIVAVRLHLEMAGDACSVEADGMVIGPDGFIHVKKGETVSVEAHQDFVQVEVDIPLKGADVAGFIVRCQGTVRIRQAFYYTLVEASRIRPADIAICIDATDGARYNAKGTERLLEGLLDDADEAPHFDVFLIGSDASVFEKVPADERIESIRIADAGLAGAAACGMIRALDDRTGYTHILLLSGDALPSIEGLKRMRMLLQLANPQHARALIQGALLDSGQPTTLFQDVSAIQSAGGCERLKPELNVGDFHDVVAGEGVDLEAFRTCGTWRFCCIPMNRVKENGLPLPLYDAVADYEYALRCSAIHMAMNGICAWRPRSADSYRASAGSYLRARNTFIAIAVDNCGSEAAFMGYFARSFRTFLRLFDYSSAELWLDGLEDYLKGPDFLMESDAARSMDDKRERDERMEPVANIGPDLRGASGRLPDAGEAADARPALLRALETIPYDRHRMPDWMLRSKPGVVPSDARKSAAFGSTALRKHLVALNEDGSKAALRKIDRERYRKLVERYRVLRFDYRNKNRMVSERYRDEFRRMVSRDFWLRYLGLE